MVKAMMAICDKNDNQKDFFPIYDERYKVIYTIPYDALLWYDKHINEQCKNN